MEFFTASDGSPIAFRDEGEGEPILFLHGLMAHGGFFARQAGLARQFRLVSVDFRGHGRSPAGPGPVTVGRLAADIAELTEALRLERIIGVGWSLGATVLWHVLLGPGAPRFAGAVVIDMTARVRNGADWTLGLSPEHCEARTLAIASDFESFARSAGQAIFAQPVAPELQKLADWAGEEFATADGAAVGSLWQSLVEDDVRDRLRQIKLPTLVVHGARSGLYGAETADHLVAAMPAAEAVRFERSGHAPQLEQPECFERTLIRFAERLSRGRTVQPEDHLN